MRCLSNRWYGISRVGMEVTILSRGCLGHAGASVRLCNALDQASRLAVPAKIRDTLVGSDHRNRRAAPGTWLARLHVYSHELARLLVDVFAHEDAHSFSRVQERAPHPL